MAFPEGLKTTTVTFGPYLDLSSKALEGTVTFVPSSNLIYAGTPLFRDPVSVKLVNGQGSTTLPCTDQDGVSNGIGLVTNWTYRAVIRFRTDVPGSLDPMPFNFSLLEADGPTFDLDNALAVPGSSGEVIPNLATAAELNALAYEVDAKAPKAYVDAAVADRASVAYVDSGLATKAGQSYVDNGLAAKVDAVLGKGLSTEDYSTAEKSVVASIPDLQASLNGKIDASGVATRVATFDPRDYGAVFDNATDDYDAMAACLAAASVFSRSAGRAVVSLPHGVAYLGKTGGGGLSLPYGSLGLTVEGKGRSVTGFRLSKEVRRLFDLSTNSESYTNITLRGFFVDNNGVTGTTVGPATTGSATTLAGSGATTSLTVASTTGWASAGLVVFPATNAGTAAGRSMRYTRTDATHLAVTNYGATATVSAGDAVKGGINDHLIVGTLRDGGQTNLCDVIDLTVEDIDVLNVPTVQPATAFGPTGKIHWGICIAPQGGATATPPRLERINVRRVRVNGGEAGVFIGSFGTSPQTYSAFLDDVNIEDCYHTTGALPTVNYFSLNFELGGSAYGRRGSIRRCHGWGSGDVGIEINSLMDGTVEDCLMEESQGGEFYHTNYGIASESIAGPPSMTLAADISSDDTTATVSALPAEGIPYNGYAVIDSEVVRYTITSSTSLTIARGFNSSTAAAHAAASGAKFRVLPVHKQRITFTRCKSRKQQITPASSSLMPKSFYATRPGSKFPHASLQLRDCMAENTLSMMGARTSGGEILYVQGWLPKIDVNGLDIQRHGFSYTTLDSRFGAAVSMVSDTGASGPATMYRLHNVNISASGSLATGASNPLYCGIAFDEGNWVLDWGSVAIDIALRNAQAQSTRGVQMAPAPGQNTFKARGVIARYKFSTRPNLDGAPIALIVSGTPTLSDLTIGVLDLDDMWFGQSSNNPNYQPLVAGSYAPAIIVDRWRHPQGITSIYATRSGRRRTLVTDDYTAASTDEFLGVQASGALTITLPSVKASGSSAAPNPSTGREVIIKDEAANAASNNITIAAASGETIDGSASITLATNKGVVRLMSIGTNWAQV